MKFLLCLLLAIGQAAPGVSQLSEKENISALANGVSNGSSLPEETVGPNDLLSVTVYDAPELSRPVRVDAAGAIRLPMVKQPVHVAGLDPAQVANAITNALVADRVLVNPLVSVSVSEYRSRPIVVVGAVRTPISFQDDGTITLLDALTRAGGLGTNAGPEILVSRRSLTADGKSVAVTQRVSARSLFDENVPAANLILQPGDIVRVPVASQFYAMGNVKKPGAFLITNGSESSVLKALALSGGLASSSAHTAYIYRVESGQTDRKEIRLKLKQIMEHKAPDVPLQANDIFYVPSANGKRIAGTILATTAGIGLGVAYLLVYTLQ